MTRLLGLYREPECSPGRHQSNDTLLLEAVAERLGARGLALALTDIDRVAAPPRGVALVLSMCQGPAALERLLEWEAQGVRILNSPRAALNTYRVRLPELMRSAGVPYPATRLIPTAGDIDVPADLADGVWLKRGDVHASVPADVQRVRSARALREGRAGLAARGVATAAVQAHRDGDEVKFYAVGDGAFFHWFYPGPSRGYAFRPEDLSALAALAAGAAGLEIYGGDAIVSPDGDLTLIDLNDWPSFAPCRHAAADAIAEHVTRTADAAWNRPLVSSTNESAV
ncbi:MAG: hypothetical protein ACM3SQ_20325 [Betaproteobacteria bacterium]